MKSRIDNRGYYPGDLTQIGLVPENLDTANDARRNLASMIFREHEVNAGVLLADGGGVDAPLSDTARSEALIAAADFQMIGEALGLNPGPTTGITPLCGSYGGLKAHDRKKEAPCMRCIIFRRQMGRQRDQDRQ